MSENMYVEDGSNDRKYFTIIPNYILNHSTMWDREVYTQMKRIAGENGECWFSQKKLADQCGMSINRLKKSINYLVEHKWIRFIGMKQITSAGGIQETKIYRVENLWKMNADFYESEGVSSNDIPTNKGISPRDMPITEGVSQPKQRGITAEAKGYHPVISNKNHNKNHNKEPINIAETSSAKKIEHNPLGAEIIKAFEEVDSKNKTYYGNKTQRSACDFLLSTYSLEEVLQRIRVLPKTNRIPFFPVINAPHDLKEKWVKLNDAVAKKRSELSAKETKIII